MVTSTQSLDYDAMFRASEDYIFKATDTCITLFNLHTKKEYRNQMAGGLLFSHKDELVRLTQDCSCVQIDKCKAISLAF